MANGPILAVVQKVGPDAHVTRGGERLPLPPGTVLLPGDEIETASSTLTILFPETGVSRVEPNSRVTLISDPNAASSTNLFAELDLIQGSVWTRFERLLGPSEWFSVEANGVVATVRGTGFGVSLVNDEVDVEVADHKVDISLKNNPLSSHSSGALGPSIDLVAGQGFRVRPLEFPVAGVTQFQERVRMLDRAEMTQSGFVFSSTRLQPATLHLPGVLRRLPKEPVLSGEILERASVLKMIQTEFETRSGFKAPTRGVLPNEEAPARLETQTTIQLQTN